MDSKFIEIESRDGRLFYINVALISCIYKGENLTIIEFIGDDENLKSVESYEEIKKKIENAGKLFITDGIYVRRSE